MGLATTPAPRFQVDKLILRTGIKLCTWAATCAALLVLSACDATPRRTPFPQARPAGLAPIGDTVVPRSAKSIDLERYYVKVQSDLLTRGLLRTDGGGPDTPFDTEDLVRNFENIALYDEYTRGALSPNGRRSSGQLSRWSGPVRINTEFGASVPLDQRTLDKKNVDAYAARLKRITGHSITATPRNANFHVFVAGEDDAPFVQQRLKQLIPTMSTSQLDLFKTLPKSFYCLVIAVSDTGNPFNYTQAVALIRAEHPDLVRLSCIHEEVAQGLGLPNDSPGARPSIFNDDDEFALLTSHDEILLQMLYDPRLKQGMGADEIRPLTQAIAMEKTGQPL